MKRILIIDDDEMIRELLRQILEKEGYEIIEASDGSKASLILSEKPTDLVITDIIMPDKEGIETIRELKKDYPNVKIIAMSGGGRIGPIPYLKIAKSMGACKTFTKPIHRLELIAAVKELIGSDINNNPHHELSHTNQANIA